MLRMRSFIACAALAVLVALAAAGCGSSSKTSSTSPTGGTAKTAKIKIGAFAGADFAPIWMGLKSGAFQQAGVGVTASTAPSGAAMAAQLTAGQIDLAGVNLSTAVQAIAKGVPMKIVATASYLTPANPSLGIVVKRGSAVQSAAQLAGKTVATAVLQTTPELGLRTALGKSGDPQSAKVISIPPPQQLAAVRAGRVDAALVPEPFLTLARGDAGVRVIDSPISAVGPHVLSGVIVARPDFLASHQAAVLAFLRALNGETAKAGQDPSLARAVIPSYTGLAPALASKITLPAYSPRIDTGSIAQQTKLMAGLGWLSKQPSLADVLWSSAPGAR